MASITSATSGLSSDPSTWTGGVVPGTTFAGTRTTTGAAVAVGATSIPVTSGAQAVVASQWIKVAGDPNPYRVLTGVAGGSAGTIVIDSPGLLVAIPASATTLSVGMVHDKVTIQHPGTNVRSTTPYRLNGAAALGATSIPVTGGSGTIVAGECVQFLHPVGTREDGAPTYDPTYYKVTTGITGNGTLVLATGLAYAMASGVQVINRGHVIELDGAHVWGDDTSSLATLGANGIVVSGTLKASRTANSQLTCRGTCFVGPGGTLDLGRPTVDPISGVTCELRINESAAPGTGKHGLASFGNPSGVTWLMAGDVRTRNTRLTNAISAGATSITVDASTGWAVGDTIVLASPSNSTVPVQTTTITGGSAPTWTVGTVSIARAAGTRVGNLSSNVAVRSWNASVPGFASFVPASTDTTSTLEIQDPLFHNLGHVNSWAGLTTGLNTQVALNVSGPALEKILINRAAFLGDNTAPNSGLGVHGAAPAGHEVRDCATYTTASNSTTLQLGAGSQWAVDMIVYGTGSAAIASSNSDGSAGAVVTGEYWGSQAISFSPAVDLKLPGTVIHSYAGAIINHGNGKVTMTGATLATTDGRLLTTQNPGSICDVTLDRCTFRDNALTANNTLGNTPNQSAKVKIIAANNVDSDSRVINYWHVATTDTSTRKRSTYAVKIQPKVASTPIYYTFTIPAIAGIAQVVKGALRFDSTYGTATPPIIALSGQGVSESYTCAATADAWDDFSFSITPTGTGDITATVTVQSTSTSGFAWLDGVYHYPMTQSVRHYGYLWQPQAAQVADPSITVSEATALAYPVSVNHGTGVITISGNATSRQVYEACMADLCATANISTAKHISTTDNGASFATTYDVSIATGVTVTGSFTTTGTVTLTGTADVAGVYTDSAGRHVKITAPNLIADTRVQLYDVVGAAEIVNTKLTSAGFSHRLVWTTDKTIRYRFGYAEGTAAKMPIEGLAVLTSAGLQILDTQVDDDVYNALAIDGGTCTEFTPDYPNLQIDIDDGDAETSVQRLYAWAAWSQTSSLGIAAMFRAVQALDTSNFLIDQSIVDARLDNVSGTPVRIIGGYLVRKDGSTVIAATSGSIQMDPGRAYVAPGGGGITAADVWSHNSRTLTNGQLLLAAGDRVLTLNDGRHVARS